MARRFFVVLLASMSLQFSWNVIGYWMHERGSAAYHFGHHFHLASADELSRARHDKGRAIETFLRPFN